MRRRKKLYNAGKRVAAGVMAVVLAISGLVVPIPTLGSDIWPQKSTAPFYCLDGGKSWKSTDRYEIYKYDTLPSALTEVQAKRLFWAYPSNWNALKEAAKQYDWELYSEIASTVSGPNVVKKIKDSGSTMFAWVADNPEVEKRAIWALEQAAADHSEMGKEAPELIRGATSENTAVSFSVPAFGPGALDTEFKLGEAFIRDIANIEAQSVWDNGSGGGEIGWLDASQEKNIVGGVLGEQLYEITWKDDSITIHNNGSAVANENAVGSNLSEEEKYNKTTVRYKITMRENSGWYTDGRWNEDYLHDWMDFKACVNAPGHQRLYKADIKIIPSDVVFYMVVSQESSGDSSYFPKYGRESSDVSFQIYRHEEIFESNYNVKLKKIDDETEKPLKGSQFYLYERFDDKNVLSGSEEDGGLTAERLNFAVWDGFQILSEGTTDEKGELVHTDVRKYSYSKTYCDGHGMPEWAETEIAEEGEETENTENTENAEAKKDAEEAAMDQNRMAAEQWLNLYHECEDMEENSGGTHFHWLIDEQIYEEVKQVMESGTPESESGPKAESSKEAFERSGCQNDCEKTYENFIGLRFSYTWKEVQAKQGYILHGLHEEDMPVEVVRTNSSEAGAESVFTEEYSDDIQEHIWYTGEEKDDNSLAKANLYVNLEPRRVDILTASAANADRLDEEVLRSASDSNARYVEIMSSDYSDEGWEESGVQDSFDSYCKSAKLDGIIHLNTGNKTSFSYPDAEETGQLFWEIRDHRTEGEIHINKRNMDLVKGESDEYSSYGDNEGDACLEHAVYGLFAADDIVHPDSELTEDGMFTNTGIVYKKHDLVAVAVTDEEGNASFRTYTEAPGMYYNYETEEIELRDDQKWLGPENRYVENNVLHGNWWIGRPLILGNYYIKELSRSEGYELSVNGKSKLWTNYGESFDTPEGIADMKGSAVISVMDGVVSMEGDDLSGNGYDQIPFQIISSDTSGYSVRVSGLPEGTEFYRVDSGEAEVTRPRVTGTENIVVRGEDGEILWKKADESHQYLKYVPEYDDAGNIIGQTPMYQLEWQVWKEQQIPEAKLMEMNDRNVDLSDIRWEQPISLLNMNENKEDFCFLKAELEKFLMNNGYETPKTYDGTYSQSDRPIYSVGVIKGQTDTYGMTTEEGEAAVKTVYGAPVREVFVEDTEISLTELFIFITDWYAENPQWSYGGLHSIEITEQGCTVLLYAGASTSGSRKFFTSTLINGELEVDKVYSVIENPVKLRWEYQEYDQDGLYQYQILHKYFYGSKIERRYYIDAELFPSVMVDENGEIQPQEHTVMIYHEQGEEIIDYLLGQPEDGYRIPETHEEEKIEITTEPEYTEQDVLIENVVYDEKTGEYLFSVEMDIENSFGEILSDKEMPLELLFMAKLPRATVTLSERDMEQLEKHIIQNYQVGQEIGYGEYLVELGNVAIGISNGSNGQLEDTYIVPKQLLYKSQYKVFEDGNTIEFPIQILERPIKEKVKIIKETENKTFVDNFRFKLYLKSNLEDLYCDENGEIVWLDHFGNRVDIFEYKQNFPELVQKIQTKKGTRRILETLEVSGNDAEDVSMVIPSYNYRKFFDAVETANIDKWENLDGNVRSTSAKPFAKGKYTGVENEINSSAAAKENAKRSDAVRQFAVTWYLEEKIQNLTEAYPELGGVQAAEGSVTYVDEVYDRALYEAILDAETYLQPFFQYDLDNVYEIMWDSEFAGGEDRDESTLAANQYEITDLNEGHAYGISEYLPYGDYVIVEQQPQKGKQSDLLNRHYKIDTPKELSLPQYYNDDGSLVNSADISWSVTEPGTKKEMSGYAIKTMLNHYYRAVLRIEKTDAETGEPILHDDSVFALYKAETDALGNGSVKRYDQETMISGSRLFLEAMGAKQITSFARGAIDESVRTNAEYGVGTLFFGYVPAGTPVCREEDGIIFTDMNGKQQGTFQNLSSALDFAEQGILQNAGYIETPEPVESGVYVLAELKSPSGYTRSKPIAVEIYSDDIQYDIQYDMEGNGYVSAVKYGENNASSKEEIGRIYVANTATSLEVSKRKPTDSYRGMKVSGRVEGSKTALDFIYGLENLELAYNSAGTYQGFGWKKGTLEYLESRKEAGEPIELVYENGVFQGYGYVRRTLETSKHKNQYVTGATLALFDAIEVRRSGDSEDYAFEGVEIKRDYSGNVTAIVVKEGYAGETEEFEKTETGHWKVKTVNREDTEVLFYNLQDLNVLEKAQNGELYGFDRYGQKIKITFDTTSIFAMRNGKAEFELCGGDFSELKYDKNMGAFTFLDEETVIYHLDEDWCRDAQVDGFTGLAYVERSGTGPMGIQEAHLFVWPVQEIKNSLGHVISKEKILTGRPGEVNAGTESAYITGSVNEESQTFEKILNPVYDGYGMVKYYPESEDSYKVGVNLYDRDGEWIGYRCEDLLKKYNQASFGILDPAVLYGNRSQENLAGRIKHRKGEAWVIPNIWITGELYPQDPSNIESTVGKPDLLRRIEPGTYIMEELKAPEGYVRSMPIPVSVEDTAEIQKISMADERIKIEISKVDGTDQYKKAVLQDGNENQEERSIENKSAYTGEMILGSKLALYKAKRVYTTDYSKYPNGYYLEKKENTPACWYIENPEDNSKQLIEAVWTTDGRAKYFEGIPAGDYILEELESPKGYLSASMEITVNPVQELQCFILKDDHTKLEIYKYEQDEYGSKVPLEYPHEAQLTLYPAELDLEGNIIITDGEYGYQNIPLAQWTTGQGTEYKEQLCQEYENMYHLYREDFDIFSWQWKSGTEVKNGTAKLEQSHSTANGETVVQLWKLDNGTRLRVTVCENDGTAKIDTLSQSKAIFEYQFDYKQGESADVPNLVSYELTNGIRRFDRIPVGTYVLVETKVPDGYKSMEPVLIKVEETEMVQRIAVENERDEQEQRGKLIIEKVDAESSEQKLSGAVFEVKNLQNGKTICIETDEYGQAILEDLPISGVYESGISGPCIYQIRELSAPEGYRRNITTWNLRFVDDGSEDIEHTLVVNDTKTVFSFQKGDFSTSHFVIGAVLSIYETRIENGEFIAYGKPLDTWISSEEAHVVKGILSCGKTYLLVEEEAPDGYLRAEPIRFTVSDDGAKITDISESLTQISITYQEKTDEIEAISVVGQPAKKSKYRVSNGSEVLFCETGTGEVIIWDTKMNKNGSECNVKSGDILMAEEIVEFWDGSSICLERKYLRFSEDSREKRMSSGRYPVTTEYVLRDSENCRVDVWSLSSGSSHEIQNQMDEDGNWKLQYGEQYTLETSVIFSDGERQKIQVMSVEFGQNGETRIDILNRETRIEIKKTDITTGRELPGAVLAVKDGNGAILEQWVSSEEEHVIEGILNPGESYILSELIAADGYAYAEEIPFSINEDGGIEKIVMEDRLTEVYIHKTDHETGNNLRGAVMVLTNSDGEVVERWISEKSAHVLRGKLIAGETYTLSEESAPYGYKLAEPMEFTVAMDGKVDQIVMENHRIVLEEIEEPEELEDKEVPETEYESYGIITAKYEAGLRGDNLLKIKIPDRARVTVVPKTGDTAFPWGAVLGAVLSLFGCIALLMGRRKTDESDEK